MKKTLHFLFLILILSSCANRTTYNYSSNNNSKNTSTARESSEGEKIVKTAKKYLGTKYKYGGITKKGLDCSGLIYVTFQEHGMTLPRISRDQAKEGKAVYIGELEAGDLIFFGATKGSKKITHAGIVSRREGKQVYFLHSSSSKGVIESDLSGYWGDKYIKARRVL